jgi:hypothetical protein
MTALFVCMKAVTAFRRGNLIRGDCDCNEVNVVVIFILVSSDVSVLAAKVLLCLFFMICERFQEFHVVPMRTKRSRMKR